MGEANVTSKIGQKLNRLAGRQKQEWLVWVGVAGTPGEGGVWGSGGLANR